MNWIWETLQCSKRGDHYGLWLWWRSIRFCRLF